MHRQASLTGSVFVQKLASGTLSTEEFSYARPTDQEEDDAAAKRGVSARTYVGHARAPRSLVLLMLDTHAGPRASGPRGHPQRPGPA
jgi:hypothetical protein